jgi:hypothetical protein
MSPDSGLDFTFEFVPGSVTGRTPDWQARRERGLSAAPAIALAAAAILLSGFAWLAVFLNSHRREPVVGDREIRQTTPPDALPVALAAALVEAGAQASWLLALATLVDLAQRGIIRVEEHTSRAWQGSHEYVIYHLGARGGLSPHEAGLLDLLFVSKSGPVTSVKLSAVARAVQSRFQVFKEPLGDALVAAGLVEPERAQTRAALVRWALALVAVAVPGFIGAAALVSSYGAWPLLVPGSIMVVAVMLFITASQYSVLSTAGRLSAVRWRAFFAFVQRLAVGREAIADASWFQRYLPFAVARGIGHRWVRRFEQAGRLEAVPAWYTPAAAAPGLRTPARSLADMLARARAAGAPKHAAA